MRFAKMFFVPVVMLFILGTAKAQEEETLLSGGLESGGYGGPVVKFTNVKGGFGVMVGGYGGWLINHAFMIGGGGYGLVTAHHPDQLTGSFYGIPLDSRMEFGYGGGILEYIFSPMSMVHSSVSVLVGAGSVSYGMQGSDRWDMWPGYARETDEVFVLEPSLNVELNVTSFFRVNAGGSYRLVSGTSMHGLTNSDLSGASINLALKFGAF